jgi:hypothetical protein
MLETPSGVAFDSHLPKTILLVSVRCGKIEGA